MAAEQSRSDKFANRFAHMGVEMSLIAHKVALVGVFLAIVLVGVPSATAAHPEEVACYDWVKSGPKFNKKPSKCVFMKNGESASAYSVYVEDMRDWKHWGAPRTTVKGTARANMGYSAPVKVRLSKIQNRCGRRVYTKAQFFFPEADGRSNFRLYPC